MVWPKGHSVATQTTQTTQKSQSDQDPPLVVGQIDIMYWDPMNF